MGFVFRLLHSFLTQCLITTALCVLVFPLDKVVSTTTADAVAVPPPNSTELFARIAARHDWQQAHLNRLTQVRTYKLENAKHEVLAQEIVTVEYIAPAPKSFTIISEQGSAFIRHHVFQRLMQDEKKRAQDDPNSDRLITPDNYTLAIVAKDKIGSFDCLIVHAIPRHKDPHLFDGNIWIESRDFAIVKIAGRLAKSPSFWIKHVDFTRNYQRVGDFWLLYQVNAVSDVHFVGTRVLTIDYQNKNVEKR